MRRDSRLAKKAENSCHENETKPPPKKTTEKKTCYKCVTLAAMLTSEC